MKALFTTTQVAKLAGVSSSMVRDWHETGLLPGFKLPGSKHRRFERRHVEWFFRKYNLPTGELERA